MDTNSLFPSVSLHITLFPAKMVLEATSITNTSTYISYVFPGSMSELVVKNWSQKM